MHEGQVLLTYFKLLQNTSITGRWGRGKVLPNLLWNHVWSTQLQTFWVSRSDPSRRCLWSYHTLSVPLPSQQRSRARLRSVGHKTPQQKWPWAEHELTTAAGAQRGTAAAPQSPILGQLHAPPAAELLTGATPWGDRQDKRFPRLCLGLYLAFWVGQAGRTAPAQLQEMPVGTI